MGSQCVQTYVNDVGGHGYTEVAKDLDSAVDLAGCVWHTIWGSKLVATDLGNQAHKKPPKITLTASEKKAAEELANKARKIAKSGTGAQHLALADEVHSFAVSVLHRKEESHK